MLFRSFVLRIKREGAARVVLAGASDLDFILEYACERHGLTFVKGVDAARAARLGSDAATVVLVSETDEGQTPPGARRLAEVLVGN